METRNVIPKVVHFLWPGGERIMPESAMRNVAAWAKANPDFTIKIWVDLKSDPDVVAKYAVLFADEAIFPAGKPEHIALYDIMKHAVCTPEIRYEIDNLWPNYGAISDMVRYLLMKNEGGAHIDCLDVFPNPHHPLSAITFPAHDPYDAGKKVFATELSRPRLLLHITAHSVVPGQEAPGTEAMLSTCGNPDMLKIIEKAMHSYRSSAAWLYRNIAFQYRPGAQVATPRERASSLSASPRERASSLSGSSRERSVSLSSGSAESRPLQFLTSPRLSHLAQAERPPISPRPMSGEHSSLVRTPEPDASPVCSTPLSASHANLFRLWPVRSCLNQENAQLGEGLADQEKVVEHRARNTLAATGPAMVIELIGQLNHAGEKVLPPEYLMPHDKERKTDWVILPKHHAISWVPMRIEPMSYEKAKESALNSMHFELMQMKIFNLPAYIELVICSVLAFEAKQLLSAPNRSANAYEELRRLAKADLQQLLKTDGRFQGCLSELRSGELSAHFTDSPRASRGMLP